MQVVFTLFCEKWSRSSGVVSSVNCKHVCTKNVVYIMYLLTKRIGAMGNYLALGHGRRTERHDREPDIFPSGPPNLFNKYFIV